MLPAKAWDSWLSTFYILEKLTFTDLKKCSNNFFFTVLLKKTEHFTLHILFSSLTARLLLIPDAYYFKQSKQQVPAQNNN